MNTLIAIVTFPIPMWIAALVWAVLSIGCTFIGAFTSNSSDRRRAKVDEQRSLASLPPLERLAGGHRPTLPRPEPLRVPIHSMPTPVRPVQATTPVAFGVGEMRARFAAAIEDEDTEPVLRAQTATDSQRLAALEADEQCRIAAAKGRMVP